MVIDHAGRDDPTSETRAPETRLCSSTAKLHQGPVMGISHLRGALGATADVNDASFRVEQGEIFGILGSNGARILTTAENIITDMYEAVRRVRFPGRQIVSAGEGALKRAPRQARIKYRLHGYTKQIQRINRYIMNYDQQGGGRGPDQDQGEGKGNGDGCSAQAGPGSSCLEVA